MSRRHTLPFTQRELCIIEVALKVAKDASTDVKFRAEIDAINKVVENAAPDIPGGVRTAWGNIILGVGNSIHRR